MATDEERIDQLEKALDSEKRFAGIETKVAKLESADRTNQIVILGETLKIPVGPWAALFLFVLLAGVALIMWVGLVVVPDGRIPSVMAAIYHMKTDGKFAPDEDHELSTIFTLATPHADSLQDLDNAHVPLSEDERKYYKLDDNALEDFAAELKGRGAQGYDRWVVIGSGDKPPKHQWLWRITWSKANPIKLEELLTIYNRHFHRSRGIYIEQQRVAAGKQTSPGSKNP